MLVYCKRVLYNNEYKQTRTTYNINLNVKQKPTDMKKFVAYDSTYMVNKADKTKSQYSGMSALKINGIIMFEVTNSGKDLRVEQDTIS